MNGDLKLTVTVCLTTRCNLRCRYCYMDARAKGQDISISVIEKIVQMVDRSSVKRLQITGGEPLLAASKLRFLVKEARSLAPALPISIQTNATLIDETWARFFKTHHIQIGISLDGPPSVNDSLRGMSNEVLRAMAVLQSQGVPFGITTVVTSKNLPHLGQLVLMLAQFKNFLGLGLDFTIRKGRAAGMEELFPQGELVRQGVEGLIEAINFLAQRGRPLFFRELERVRSNKSGEPYCDAASGRSLAVSPEGRLYPCGQCIGDNQFLLGHINDLLPLANPLSLLNHRKWISHPCRNCSAPFPCPGDCPSRTFYNRPFVRTNAPACIAYKVISETLFSSCRLS